MSERKYDVLKVTGNPSGTVVDAEFFDEFSKYTWGIRKSKNGGAYVTRQVWDPIQKKQVGLLLHHAIFGKENIPLGMLVDHTNRDTFDNRRENLRLVDKYQNMFNQGPNRGRKFKGTAFSSSGYWRARLEAYGIKFTSTGHKTEENAAKAYDLLAYAFHGEHAYINFPGEISNKIHSISDGLAMRDAVQDVIDGLRCESEKYRLAAEGNAAIFKMYIWREQPCWIAVAHARTVAEARSLIVEDSNGDGDDSTPVRVRMLAAVKDRNPEVHFRDCGEAVITTSGEVEEYAHNFKTQGDTIDALRTELAAERERSNNMAREISILRVDSAKTRAEALREAAAACMDPCAGLVYKRTMSYRECVQAILSLIEPKEGGAK